MHVVVLSSLFPSAVQPGAGLFVRERMFRLAQRVNLCVVAPAPWFPFQQLLRLFRPFFRPGAPRYEMQSGIDVWYPRYFSFPGVLKSFDAIFLALGAYHRMRTLRRAGRLDLIDAHFGYPDGCAAAILGRWLDVPVSVTLRGSEARKVNDLPIARRLAAGLKSVNHIFAVSDSLKAVAVNLGIAADRIQVIGNGVDGVRFSPVDQRQARDGLNLPVQQKVLVSVGGLVAGKGFQHVIEILPSLIQRFPGLMYLVVGAPTIAGDNSAELHAQVSRLHLAGNVRFLGYIAPDDLAVVLSAADVFVLATAGEGWANVFLEAMACGLPVVTTDVGGNRQVVCNAGLGTIVPHGDAESLFAAIAAALERSWDRKAIRQYAEQNSWGSRIDQIETALTALHAEHLRRQPDATASRPVNLLQR